MTLLKTHLTGHRLSLHQSFGLMAVTPTFRSSSVTKPSSIVKDPCGSMDRKPGHKMTQTLRADVTFV